MGPAAKATTNLVFKMEMGNFFMNIDGDMKTDAKPPMKMMFKGVNGYDATTKKMMRMDWDSMGGMAMLSSAGWEGDKMVFAGDATMMGQKDEDASHHDEEERHRVHERDGIAGPRRQVDVDGRRHLQEGRRKEVAHQPTGLPLSCSSSQASSGLK